MADKYDVVVKVVSVKGTCAAGHKVGDEWLFAGRTPGGECTSAFTSLVPILRVLRFGGTCPWQKDPDKASIGCPDPVNQVVFELTRLRK